MKSIQTKFVLLILISIFVSVMLIGGVGIISAQSAIDNTSTQIMNSICSEKAQELNNTAGRIEQTVNVLAKYAIDNLESIDKLSDVEYVREYTGLLHELYLTAARETEGALAAYIRFAPEISSPTAGVFLVINTETGDYEDTELTDLSAYERDDKEHVGWFYEPIDAGRPVWMLPYQNRNINIYMISYVAPIYLNGDLVGIVGMDIDFSYITSTTDSIRIYETGYAFLTDIDFNIIHHRSIPAGTSVRVFSESLADAENAELMCQDKLFEYTWNGEKKKVAFRTLDNGMCLAATAPAAEIDSIKNVLIHRIIVLAVLIMGVFLIITTLIARSIVSPLKELNNTAKKIASGDLDVTLSCRSKDEVGTLTRSLSETVKQLKARINYINRLAYVDKLTGAKNNTAYLYDTAAVKEEISRNEARFTVLVVDVNGLKHVNDNYGHEAGNTLIITAANILISTFGMENVYRTGGDEFAVLLRGKECDHEKEKEQKFRDLLEKQTGQIILSAAIGMASFEAGRDSSYQSVYDRADEAMYTNKREMKERGEDSVVRMKPCTVD